MYKKTVDKIAIESARGIGIFMLAITMAIPFACAQPAQERSNEEAISYVLQVNDWKLSADDFENQYIQPFLTCIQKQPHNVFRFSMQSSKQLRQLQHCMLNDILFIQSLAQIARDKNMVAGNDITEVIAEHKKTKELPKEISVLINFFRTSTFAKLKKEYEQATHFDSLYLYYDECQKEVFAAADIKSFLLAAKVVSDMKTKYVVTDADILNFYNKNLEEFRIPVEYKIKIIVVPTQAQAEEIYIQLMQGKDFSGLAKQYSIDSLSKERGGDLGWRCSSSEPSEEICRVVTALDKGYLSGVFKYDGRAFAIVKLEDTRGGTVATFEYLKHYIKEYLEAQKLLLQIKEVLEAFLAKAHIVRNEPLLSKKDIK